MVRIPNSIHSHRRLSNLLTDPYKVVRISGTIEVMKPIQSFITLTSRNLRHNSLVGRFRNFGNIPTSFPRKKSQAVHATGLLTVFGCIAGVLALSPMEEFESIERDNVAYHHHLHPR